MNMEAPIEFQGAVNIEAEQQLLGAILLNNDALAAVRSTVKAEHFGEQLHRTLFEVALTMVDRGDVANPITIRPYIDADAIIDEHHQTTVGGYVARLVSECAGIFMAKAYGKAVLEAWQRRRLYDMGMKLSERARFASLETNPESLAAELGDQLVAIINSGVDAKKSRQYGDILLSAMQGVQDRRNDDSGLIRWFLPEVDEIVGPVRLGNLVGLMSDSGGGKTSFSAMQCRFAAEAGIPTAFFSIEITEEEAALQIAAQRIGVSMGEIDAFDLRRPKQDLLMIERETGQKLPLVIESFDKADLAEIGARIAMLKKRMGLKFVMIDHAKLIDLPRGDMFAERVNSLWRGLKSIAKKTDVGIVVLIQRNGDWKKRDNPRPIPSDAYGGGGVKQNVDGFFSLYRPEVLWTEALATESRPNERARLMGLIDRAKGYAWVINHKFRRGEALKDRRIRFEAEFTRFTSDRTSSTEIEQELPF